MMDRWDFLFGATEDARQCRTFLKRVTVAVVALVIFKLIIQ